MFDNNSTLVRRASLQLFFLILALTFLVEASIMVLSQMLFDKPQMTLMFGILDAALLTVVIAPAIWLLVVKPIQTLAESREHLLHALLAAQEHERSRIARDLHDELGQQLTAIQVGLGTLEAAHELQEAKKLAAGLRKVGAMAQEEVRRLSSGLRPGVLEELGLIVALERLCEDFETRSGLTVHRNLGAEIRTRLPQSVEIALYRILQESLTNVAKHAEASLVEVSMNHEKDQLILAIADNGKGLHGHGIMPEKVGRDGLGLSFIQERVQMLGGISTIAESKLGGTLIRITVPTPR